MIERINSIFDIFDVGDIKFFFLVAKKNIKNLVLLSLFISTIALFISFNQQKKYLSKGIIVIEPDDNNIVNIQEYRNFSQGNRINNQIAMFKSDQVLEYIINDKENLKNFEIFFAENNQNFIQKLFKKKKSFNINSLKSILSSSLKIKNINNSDILVLSFISTNPRVAKLALERVINSYQKYEIDSRACYRLKRGHEIAVASDTLDPYKTVVSDNFGRAPLYQDSKDWESLFAVMEEQPQDFMWWHHYMGTASHHLGKKENAQKYFDRVKELLGGENTLDALKQEAKIWHEMTVIEEMMPVYLEYGLK